MTHNKITTGISSTFPNKARLKLRNPSVQRQQLWRPLSALLAQRTPLQPRFLLKRANSSGCKNDAVFVWFFSGTGGISDIPSFWTPEALAVH